jgi:hypothetical protein
MSESRDASLPIVCADFVGRASGESQADPLLGTPGRTKPEEVKSIRWLAKQTSGNILEIGCNDGQTTLELATALLDTTVYALRLHRALHDVSGAAVRKTQSIDPLSTRVPLAQHEVLHCPSAEIDYRSWATSPWSLSMATIPTKASRPTSRERWTIWTISLPPSPRANGSSSGAKCI